MYGDIKMLDEISDWMDDHFPIIMLIFLILLFSCILYEYIISLGR